jgi:hypothetical protein
VSVSGNKMNKFINEKWRTIIIQHGPVVFEALGSIIHRIFSHAATTVPYKDIFNDTE